VRRRKFIKDAVLKTVYDFFATGLPKAQPRPRAVVNKSTGKIHAYNPDTAKEWKQICEAMFLRYRKPIIKEPVFFHVVFFMPMPQLMLKTCEGRCLPHTVKPDIDNLQKVVMDAATDAGIWKDDSLVYASYAEKWYSPRIMGARIVVKVGN
jgi:Holliday junction resolvase RusA-like endonuclease